VKQWEVIKKTDGAVRYVAKYAKKQKQKEVPEGYQNVGRFWGTSPDVKAVPVQTLEMTAPEILRRMGLDSVKFIKGWGRGGMDLRRYLWDQAEKFLVRDYDTDVELAEGFRPRGGLSRSDRTPATCMSKFNIHDRSGGRGLNPIRRT
jgi:hypothetical protein